MSERQIGKFIDVFFYEEFGVLIITKRKTRGEKIQKMSFCWKNTFLFNIQHLHHRHLQ